MQCFVTREEAYAAVKRWALAVGMAVMLCFSAAQATPATPYDPELMLWYPALTAKQQTIFDLCYAAAVQGQESVPLQRAAAIPTLARPWTPFCWIARSSAG